VERMCVAV